MVEPESARDLAARTGRSIRTVRAWALRDDFPAPVATGPRNTHLYDPGQVDRWLTDHPRLAGPPPVDAAGEDDELVTLNAFAARLGLASGTVYQYADRPPATGNRYRLGDLQAWWAARPGQGARTDLR